jgi:hypothetical protein
LSWNGSAYNWTDGSGLYIQNQNAVNQAANYRISGTGQINTALGVGVAPGSGGINTAFSGEAVFVNIDPLSAGVEVRDHDGDDNGGPYVDFARNNSIDYHARLQVPSIGRFTIRNMTDNLLVGINTSTAGAPLHVVGNGNTLRLQGTDHSFVELYPDGPVTRKGYLGFPGPTVDDIYVENEIAGRHLVLEGSGDGFVGIGGVPAAKLDVFDRMRMREGANGSAGSWYHNGGADRFFFGNKDNDNLSVFGVGYNDWFVDFNRVNGRTRMRTNTSNLGVHNAANLEISNAGVGHATISFHNEGVWGAHLGLENHLQTDGGTRGTLSTRGWSGDTYLGYTGLRVGEIIWGINGSNTLTRSNAGLQGDAGAKSGFYETSAPVNYYAGASSWQHLIDVRHSNPGNNYAMQIAGSFFDQRFFGRKTNNNPSQAWTEFITTNILNYTGEFCRNQNIHGVGIHNSGFSTSQYVCFLVQITGKFEGGGEVVTVGDADGNGQWDVRIQSAQAAVGGCMRCLQIRP